MLRASPRAAVARLVLALAALIAALAFPPALQSGSLEAGAAKPNIVLVLTDDQRWDTVRAMPAVSRELVARGVTFTNAFVVNPLCCPSRVSILTGRYSHSTGVYSNRGRYGGAAAFDETSTLATWLSEAGYRTAYVGKYLNRYWGTHVPLGWERWFGYLGSYVNFTVNDDGSSVFYGSEPDDYATDVFADEAVSFVEETRDPFFLVFAPFAPHLPAMPAARHAAAFAGLRPWRPPAFNEADVSDKPRWLRQAAGVSAAYIDHVRRAQLQSLLAVDEAVARIVRTLKETGRIDNTILVFTSDNGFSWGEHRHLGKHVPYEESIRVPLVMRFDALGLGRRIEKRFVTNIDLAPTLARLAGTAAPAAEGRDLLPLLRGLDARWRRTFLVENLGRPLGDGDAPTYCAVRTARFKYVAYSTREEELYDLRADPHELRNRVGDPALRENLRALRAQLKESCDPPPPGFKTDWIGRRGLGRR
ncbi:MAG: sulfatase [Actinomycetota bacterium]|nr:sulfatase [Actinomycetota bacterium]